MNNNNSGTSTRDTGSDEPCGSCRRAEKEGGVNLDKQEYKEHCVISTFATTGEPVRCEMMCQRQLVHWCSVAILKTLNTTPPVSQEHTALFFSFFTHFKKASLFSFFFFYSAGCRQVVSSCTFMSIC